MKTIIGKITIDILTSIYQPFWFAILLSIMTMFFYLYVKCPEGAGKGWKAAIRTWIDHFKRDREFLINIYCFSILPWYYLRH